MSERAERSPIAILERRVSDKVALCQLLGGSQDKAGHLPAVAVRTLLNDLAVGRIEGNHSDNEAAVIWHLILLIGVVMTMPLHAVEAKMECPSDPALRAQALRKQGASGKVTWLSLAIPEKTGSDQYCYERTVSVPQPAYVHWPLAGMSKLFVKDMLTTANCCWPGPRTERGPLEYGTRRQKVETDVYRGQGEPGGDTFWAVAYGSLSIGGVTIPVNVMATAANPKDDKCFQEVTNSGADILASFPSKKGPTAALLVKSGATEAVYFARGEFAFQPALTNISQSRLTLFVPSCGELSWPPTIKK